MYVNYDNSMGQVSSDTTFFCPYYYMYHNQCPFNNVCRQRTEEFPIHQQAAPTSPPPSYTPKLTDVAQPSLTSVEFGAISPCIFKNTYLWLRNGDAFWAYLTFINRKSISGWRYVGERWVNFTVNLKQVKNYICT